MNHRLFLPALMGAAGILFFGIIGYANFDWPNFSVAAATTNSEEEQVAPPTSDTVPTDTWWEDSGTNIYSSNTGNVGIGDSSPLAKLTVGSGDKFRVSSTGIVTSVAGSASAPTYSFVGDANTGIFRPNYDNLAFATAGLNRMMINGQGYMGIGITAPVEKLHVSGAAVRLENGTKKLDLRADGTDVDLQSSTSDIYIRSYGAAGQNRVLINPLALDGNVGIGTETPLAKLHVVGDQFRLEKNGKQLNLRADGNAVDLQSPTNDLYIRASGTGGNNDVFINPFAEDGNVGIGTILPDEKLSVAGAIHAREVRVDSYIWADDVFDASYSKPTLPELKSQIETLGHLPEIPSEKEILANGIALSEMQTRLMRKIEELTLYSIELEERIADLESER